MQYVYVLTSDENDFFLEQLVLSITSLRLKMSNAAVTVLTDDITAATLTEKRSIIYKLADEVKVLSSPSELNKLRRSRWLKTTMRKNIIGDFLYIDCDTVIADDLSDIGNTKADVAAILDQHSFVREHPLKKRFFTLDKELGFSSAEKTNKQFNGGILFCRDTPLAHDFFDEWHKLWLFSISKGINVDQPSLNQAGVNKNNIITELGGIWNCQIEFSGLQFLSQAKIIHYFTSGRNEKPYLLANNSFFEEIKKTGCIPEEIFAKLQDPRELFCSQVRLVADKRMLAIIDSAVFDYLLTRTFDKNNNSKILNVLSSFISNLRETKGKIHEILHTNRK
jgi:lipopolysaccharide biosynthesis glycosyltransferase